MKSYSFWKHGFVISCLLSLMMAACSPTLEAASPAPTPIPAMTAEPSAMPTLTAIPSTESAAASPAPSTVPSPTSVSSTPSEHYIGVRVVKGVGEFYNRTTGNKFVPRGMNYVRLAQQTKTDGSSTFGHALFDPGRYDASRVSGDLQKMHAAGYNVIRVFLSPDTMGTASGGLSLAYMQNIVDLLSHAKQNNIYVIFTLDWIPGGKYGSILNADCCSTFALMNANFLPPAGLEANQVFYQDFIRELIALNAPTEVIFSYQLRNEMFYDTDHPPLSFSSGVVKTANGKSYDMSQSTEKELMVKENLVYWIDEMRASILEVDPTALVSVGFFHPQKPHPARIGDLRLAVTEPAIWQSMLDFVDLHPYPGFELNLEQYVENYGINGMQEKPIIMGEFGAARSAYATEAGAARALHDWQVKSCDYGFDGWLLWTWDTEEQTDFYTGLTGQGQINQVLAPIHRPDPCQAGAFDFFEYNLALGMPAQASRSLPDQPPSGAVDGSMSQGWGAGDFATQWIQVDLGKSFTIGLIRLVIAQFPAGDTRHQVWVGSTSDQLYLLHTFEGYTVDSQVLEFKPGNPVENVRYLRVVTKQSPSWVAWKEIQALAP